MSTLLLAQATHRLLKLLPPEEAHSVGLRLLRYARPSRLGPPDSLALKTWLGELQPPIGLAAGFDKTGACVAELASLGFGYIVAGSVTLRPRSGNRKPRIVRRRGEALVNAMGLPNPGVEAFSTNLVGTAPSAGVPVVASIAGSNPEEILRCYERLRGVVSAVEVNLSSPSLEDAQRIWSEPEFKILVDWLDSSKWCPLALKIPPLAREDLRKLVLRAVEVWADNGMDCITAVNTLPVKEERLSTGFGGLSGRPLNPYMVETLKEVRRIVDGGCAINAVGGIFTGDDAIRAFRLGASTVQIYTALAYRGPLAARKIVTEMSRALARMGAHRLEEILP
ncbi:MAG: dihydroorotate dehydrogenase 2 [Nitrososphaerota archaeon]